MIGDKYFLLIPVYRLCMDEYKQKMEQDFDEKVLSQWTPETQLAMKDSIPQIKQHHFNTYGGAWEFNEIVGYIKLYFIGNQVRGEYWSTQPMRKVKTRKKQFEYKTQKLASEISVSTKTNESILEAIEKYLNDCERELKNRYLDLREFNNIKKYINWVSVYEEVNLFG